MREITIYDTPIGMKYPQVKDGFVHQKLLIIPKDIISNLETHPITSAMYITNIGYFPHAKYHYIERPEGAEDHILIFCAEGEGVITEGNQDVVIKAGQFSIIPKRSAHRYCASATNPWSIYWMHFGGDRSLSFIEYVQAQSAGLYLSEPYRHQLIDHITAIITLLQRGYSIDHCIQITAKLFSLFSGLGDSQYRTPSGRTIAQSPIQQVIDRMEQQITGSITLDELTDIAHMSKSYFITLFKEQTGFPPIEYFIQMKMQRACHELDMTEQSVKTIALDLGYEDPYYFSRIFKRVIGYSPRAYRELVKG